VPQYLYRFRPTVLGERVHADAVKAIKRFLVPFECWSMLEYGLYGEWRRKAERDLRTVNDQSKASALLLLLDRTVGTSESAVIPYDLTAALD
jgi:hypothetical protein